MLRLWFIIALVFIVGVVATINYFSAKQEAKNSTPIVTVISKPQTGTPQLGGHFSLTDQHGVPRTDADFKGKYQLIYFGYAFCPDICPMALSHITQALKILGNKAEQVTPIFITVDPGRDNVEQLAVYVQNFHPSLVALTGTEQQVKQAKQAFKVYSSKVEEKGTTDYLVDHTSIIYLMDRQGKFVTHFNHETTPSVIADTLKSLL